MSIYIVFPTEQGMLPQSVVAGINVGLYPSNFIFRPLAISDDTNYKFF